MSMCYKWFWSGTSKGCPPLYLALPHLIQMHRPNTENIHTHTHTWLGLIALKLWVFKSNSNITFLSREDSSITHYHCHYHPPLLLLILVSLLFLVCLSLLLLVIRCFLPPHFSTARCCLQQLLREISLVVEFSAVFTS